MLNILGWIVLGIIIIAAAYWYFGIYQRDKKLYNKRITAFKSNGLYWKPFYRDFAKTIKIGSGGFEIFFLKKAKTWKIAYGGEIGDDYYFYVMPDGYWYNALQQAGISWLDKAKGLIPIVTTNPLMRGQYTSLEKQINDLTRNKVAWWDKYGSMVLSIAFILIAGVLMWLMFKEYHQAMSELSTYSKQLGLLLEQVNRLLSNAQSINAGTGGLVKV